MNCSQLPYWHVAMLACCNYNEVIEYDLRG
jgi:hypothetical protein